MILFSKKALILVPMYFIYITLALLFIAIIDVEFMIQVFTDKMFVYLMFPPFICGISLIEESLKKPVLVRMKNRKQAMLFLLLQQYIFAVVYWIVWFLLIIILARGKGEQILVADMVAKLIRYILCSFLFVNVSGCLKRSNHKILSTIPFVAAYMLFILDVLAITSITGKAAMIIYVMFAWTFYGKSMLGIFMLVIFCIATYLFMHRLDEKADVY